MQIATTTNLGGAYFGMRRSFSRAAYRTVNAFLVAVCFIPLFIYFRNNPLYAPDFLIQQSYLLQADGFDWRQSLLNNSLFLDSILIATGNAERAITALGFLYLLTFIVKYCYLAWAIKNPLLLIAIFAFGFFSLDINQLRFNVVLLLLFFILYGGHAVLRRWGAALWVALSCFHAGIAIYFPYFIRWRTLALIVIAVSSLWFGLSIGPLPEYRLLAYSGFLGEFFFPKVLLFLTPLALALLLKTQEFSPDERRVIALPLLISPFVFVSPILIGRITEVVFAFFLYFLSVRKISGWFAMFILLCCGGVFAYRLMYGISGGVVS